MVIFMKKGSIILSIDTTRQNEIFVAIVKNGRRLERRSSSATAQAQNVLPLIEKLLAESDAGPADIGEIHVNPGPGSFTGVRVGVAVANTLGSLLSVPINGEEFVLPIYSPSKLD